MREILSSLIESLASQELQTFNIIPWGSPIPAFGDPTKSTIATVGINPSNREFVDKCGSELDGKYRRFHTLTSLEISRWDQVDAQHLHLILNSCRAYFARNPYQGWFNVLEYVLSGVGVSYYSTERVACHLDLVPYATTQKWGDLKRDNRDCLLSHTRKALGNLIRKFSS